MTQKLSDFIAHIKSIPHVVENEAHVAFTHQFENKHKKDIVLNIRTMSRDAIISKHLDKCHSPGYQFQELIYSTSYTNGNFSKQFLYDIHTMVEAQLNLTDFKIVVNKYSDEGDPECNVYFYMTELKDDEPKPDYFEYFKFVKTT